MATTTQTAVPNPPSEWVNTVATDGTTIVYIGWKDSALVPYLFDIATESWSTGTTKAYSPFTWHSGVHSHQAVINGVMHFVLGSGTTSGVHAYDIAGDSWVGPVTGSVNTTYTKFLTAHDGDLITIDDEEWEFTGVRRIDGVTGEESTLPDTHAYHAEGGLLSWGGDLYIFAGSTSTSPNNVVLERYTGAGWVTVSVIEDARYVNVSGQPKRGIVYGYPVAMGSDILAIGWNADTRNFPEAYRVDPVTGEYNKVTQPTVGVPFDVPAIGVGDTVYLLRGDSVRTFSNTRPVMGDITAPTDTDTWGETHTIDWAGATDPDADTIEYFVDLSLNGGSTWTQLRGNAHNVAPPTTDAEATVDFSGYDATANALIRVIAWDGAEYSEPAYSDAFSINSPPNSPSLQTRPNFDINSSATFNWTFSDPDGQAQTAYQLVIEYASSGTVAYDSGKVASGTASMVLPAYTLTNDRQYRWRVRTWDTFDTAGTWSSWSTFYTSRRPLVTIDVPATNGSEVNGPQLTVDWSFIDAEAEPQRAYHIIVENLTINSTVLDSGKVLDSVNTERPVTGLEDSQDYRISLTVWDAKDIVSPTVTRTFTTNFAPPPGGYVTAQNDGDHIVVFISNPVPATGEADTVSNDLYRRKPGEEWVRIAANLSKNGYYDDYAVESGQTYEYFAIARSEEGLTAAASIDSASISLMGVWLHDPADPSATIHRFEFDGAGRAEDWSPEVQMLGYSGRSLPVAEFGTQTTQAITATIQLANDNDTRALRDLAHRRTTLCYRDGRGRKMFGIITALPITDTAWGNLVELTLHGVAYDEEI